VIRLSKLVEEILNNRELVYHGTDVLFNKFDISKIGSRTDPGFFGRGFYFIDDKEIAKRWGKYIVSAYVNLKNPLYTTGIEDFIQKSGYKSPLKNNLSREQNNLLYKKEINRITDELIKKGYDGVIYTNSAGKKQYISFFVEPIEILKVEKVS
jgi:hypothetical protein